MHKSLTVGAALAAVIIILFMILHEADIRPLLSWAIEKSSGYTVEIRGPLSVDLSMNPSLSASGIRFWPPAMDAPVPVSRIDKIRVRIAVLPLFLGRLRILNLEVDDAFLSLAPGREEEPSATTGEIHLPETVTLHNVSLFMPPRGPLSSTRFFLRDLRFVQSQGSMAISGSGNINSQVFRLHGRARESAPPAGSAGPYDVDLGIETAGALLKVTGTVDDFEKVEDLRLDVALRVEKTEAFLNMLGIETGPIGRTSIRAKVSGSLASPGIPDLHLSIGDSPRLRLTVSSAVPDLRNGSGARVEVSGTCTDRKLLSRLSPDRFPLHAAAFQGLLRSSHRGLSLENIQASAVAAGQVQAKARGNIFLGPRPFHGDAWTFSLKGSLSSPAGALFMETAGNAQIIAGDGGLSVGKIRMHCTASATRPGGFKEYLGGYVDSFEGSCDLAGYLHDFSVANARAEARLKHGGSVSLQGSVGHVTAGDRPVVRGVDLDILGHTPDSSLLSRVSDGKFKDLGSLRLKAHLDDAGGFLDLTLAELRASRRGRNTFLVRGRARDLLNPHRMVLDASFETSSKTVLEDMLHRQAQKVFPIRGRLKVLGESGRFNIRELSAASPGLDGFYVMVKGTITYVSSMPVFRGSLASGIPDLSWVSLPAHSTFKTRGRITVRKQGMAFAGTMMVGSTRSGVDITASTAGMRPMIVADIRSPAVYLKDLAAASDSSRETKTRSTRIFSTEPLPLDLFRSMDIKVDMAAGRVHGYTGKEIFHDFNLGVSLEDGLLRVDPLTLRYAGGSVSMNLSINVRARAPDLKLRLTSEDMDLSTLQEYLDKPQYLKGELSASADLQGQGSSAHEIASSLSGDAEFAIENGRINRKVRIVEGGGLDIVLTLTKSIADDALNLIIPSRSRNRFIPLHCLATHFNFQQGIGLSKIIALDTNDLTARGVGSLDLKNETMHLVIRPRKKRALIDWSSPIDITGPMAKPSIRTIPFREAGQISAAIFAPYVFFPVTGLGYLKSILTNDKDEVSPCAGLDLGKE